MHMDDNDRRKKRDAASLGLGANIMRRDFIGGALVGAGATLLTAVAPGLAGCSPRDPTNKNPLPSVRGAGIAWRGTEVPDDWAGPGGLGDYADSNGNTAKVIRAAHAGVRNHEFEKKLAYAVETNEDYDMVIVGAGISGLFGAYDLLKKKPDAKVLVLDNHAIFGGEAKQNQLEVDGYTLYAPQGPSVYRSSKHKPGDLRENFSDELGLPSNPAYSELAGNKRELAVARDYWTPQLVTGQADVGYYYDSTGFVINPHANAFRHAPVSDQTKAAMAAILSAQKRTIEPVGDVGAWMDSMTYQEFLQKAYNADVEAVKICEDDMISGGTGLGGDVYTAAIASFGSGPYSSDFADYMQKDQYQLGFPTGNSGIARKLVKLIIPGAIKGDRLSDILFGKINWGELDKRGSNARIRLNATVVGVKQSQPTFGTPSAKVYYTLNGNIHVVNSKTVLMATPQMVNRNTVFDLPSEYVNAMGEFNHAPILKVNVALRNWKFIEKAGISAFKWWGHFPAYGAVLRDMIIDGAASPCDPSKPTVIPLYIPACATLRGMPLREQAFAARMIMFSLSYADIELLVREQFTKMFSSFGFDAKRDIAGIIANRWGHAFVCPGPGFYHGKNGAPTAADVIKQPHGAIAFAHSDMAGLQDWQESARYARAGVERLVGLL